MTKNIIEYSDAELYNMLFEDKSTSERAFKEIYARYSKNVLSYCRHFLKTDEDAEDAFQEAFMKLYSAKTANKEMTNMAGYLITITRNICYNHLRDHNIVMVEYDEYLDDKSEFKIDNLDISLDNQTIGQYIDSAINELSDHLREVFILREYEGFSYNDIVEITNETLDVVKVRLHRAKKQVREFLEVKLRELVPEKAQKVKW
ncbi:MAG: RNA polymerase sigma factor [bacterium]